MAEDDTGPGVLQQQYQELCLQLLRAVLGLGCPFFFRAGAVLLRLRTPPWEETLCGAFGCIGAAIFARGAENGLGTCVYVVGA